MNHKCPLLWVPIVLLLVITLPVLAEKSQTCPEECRCSSQDGVTTAHCTSFSFIQKLSPKELASIDSLDVSSASVTTLDKKILRKLANLERFNLSHNRLTDIKHISLLPKLTYLNLRSNLIKSFTGKQLPRKLEILDISNNYIRELPHDLPLTNLKRIYLGGNSFSCSRESLDVRDALLERKIKIIGRTPCHSPTKFLGKSWADVVDFDEYFKLQNQDDMLADEAVGSGFGEGSGSNVFEAKTTISPEMLLKETDDRDFEFEDSEGSGVGEITTEYIAALEVTTEEDEGSGFLPFESDLEEFDKVTENFSIPVDEEIIPRKISPDVMEMPLMPSTEAPIEEPTEESSEEPATDNPIEEKIVTESPSTIDHINQDRNKGSLGTHIFLILIVLCLVALLIYAIKKNREHKRRKARQKREDLERQADIELLPKTNLSEKQNGNPESSPLMKVQNEDIEKEKGMIDNGSPVELRKDEKLDSLRDSLDESMYLNVPTYPAQDVVSVKVKASEIPDSIPRTPILVDRRKTSDGQNIVITPNLNQRASTGN